MPGVTSWTAMWCAKVDAFQFRRDNPGRSPRRCLARKRVLALAIVAALVLCVPAIADQTKPAAGKPDHIKGTITAWDDATKTFTVKGKDDKEYAFSWNDATKVNGTPKVGEEVKVEFAKEGD